MVRSYQRQESHLAKLAKSHGRDYGKPKPGSESEKRSIAYQVDSEATVLMSISFSYTFLLLLKSEHCFIVQKEVIKECVHMCQMVAQFGTRSICVFVCLYFCICIFGFVYLYLCFCIFVLCTCVRWLLSLQPGESKAATYLQFWIKNPTSTCVLFSQSDLPMVLNKFNTIQFQFS